MAWIAMIALIYLLVLFAIDIFDDT